MSTARIPVIIDTDPGVDDIVALLFALSSPELEILAITLSFGNTDVGSSRQNVLKLYGVLEKHFQAFPTEQARYANFIPERKPILVTGRAGPLDGAVHHAQYFHGNDGLGDIRTRHPEIQAIDSDKQGYLQLSDKSAVDVCLGLLNEFPARQISYIALGPLTNLSQLLQRDACLVRRRVGMVFSMGGALDVPGNTSPSAEYNYFADPYAVHDVLTPTDPDKGFPLDRFFMLPLDITTPHELPFKEYIRRVDEQFVGLQSPSSGAGKTPLVHFTSSFLEHTRSTMLQFGKDAMELHDIVAVWCALANPPRGDDKAVLSAGWTAKKRKFQVERTGELTRGMLVVDRREDESAYAPGANRAMVQEELDKQSLKHETSGGEFSAVPAEVDVENAPVGNEDVSAVFCVSKTPGPKVLLDLLFKRVWGV
ncbi:nucleoside hydrolase [Cylindrobasidium torrendii FP15055 ss-10]|uniref:Nucleoside hydrolase n=1 Tax=Cylindrobasidium torrendii FP15055 ss-10 TaxID=1314674 RepID=A0A0D7B6N1_9AGAR|nr:nucleoside hydrolase [Cylindrobasidium torrendii FP15055 ss-10]